MDCFLCCDQARIYARATGAPAQGGKFPGAAYYKKIEIEVWYAEKKGCPRERSLSEIYTKNNVGTTAQPSFLVTTLLALEGAEAIAYCLPA
jgi:hypothetical protein